MKVCLLTCLLCLANSTLGANDPQKLYYLGQAKVKNLIDGTVTERPFLYLRRIYPLRVFEKILFIMEDDQIYEESYIFDHEKKIAKHFDAANALLSEGTFSCLGKLPKLIRCTYLFQSEKISGSGVDRYYSDGRIEMDALYVDNSLASIAFHSHGTLNEISRQDYDQLKQKIANNSLLSLEELLDTL